MRITLNLASRPYFDKGPALRRLRIAMGGLAAALVLLVLGLVHVHQTAKQMAAQEAVLNQEIAGIDQEQQQYQREMQQPENASVLTQAQFLNQLFDEKSFSWTAAMEELERVLPPGVQVTAIEPSRGKDGTITLRIRVSGQRERAVQMIRNMEHSRRFEAPRTAGENAETASPQGNLRPAATAVTDAVTFDILAEYSPATLAERRAEIAAQGRVRLAASPGQGAGSGVVRGAQAYPNTRPTGQIQGLTRMGNPALSAPNGQGMPAMPQRRGLGPGFGPSLVPSGPGAGGPQ